MDRDALRERLDRWVDAGLIDESTASAIMAHESETAEGSTFLDSLAVENRLVAAVSLMGAVLVAAGIGLYLATQWGDLPDGVKTAVLVVAPTAPATAGWYLRRAGVPRVGIACWFLGVALVGPSLYLLAGLHAPDLGLEWVLGAWAAVAVPAGHRVASRPTTALGLLVGLAAVGVAVNDPAFPYVLAFVGAAVVAAGHLLERVDVAPTDVYGLVGPVPAVGLLVLLGLREGAYEGIVPSVTPALAVAVAAAAAGVLAVAVTRRGDRPVAPAAPAVPAAAGVGAVAIVLLTPPVPAFASFLAVHLLLLATLLAEVGLAVVARDRALVNVVAVAFLLQVLTFLVATVGDALSGALALVVAGVVLLAAAVALERGRRRVLAMIVAR